jgi:hypothetical protein
MFFALGTLVTTRRGVAPKTQQTRTRVIKRVAVRIVSLNHVLNSITEPGAVEAVNKLLNALIDAQLLGVQLSAYYSSPLRSPTRRLGYLEPERIVAKNKQFIHSFVATGCGHSTGDVVLIL